MSNLDYQAWHCEHEKEGERVFCPPEGCSKTNGCARDDGWKPGDPTPHIYSANKKGKTVKVRVAVAVSVGGEVSACSVSGAFNDAEALNKIRVQIGLPEATP